MWVFLTKNKTPPISTVQKFLKTYGLKSDSVKTIRTDQGGELAKDSAFRNIVNECGYQVQINGSVNSSQNGKVERPHRTLSQMMRAALLNADLHPKF